MKAFISFLLVLLISFPASSGEKESAYDRVMRTGILRCGYYLWPPYFMKDPNTGALSGLAVDYADAAGRLLDLKIEYVEWGAIGAQTEELKKGLYDASCLDTYFTFPSIKVLDFSDPFYYAPYFVYVHAEDGRFKSLVDLNQSDITFVGIDGDVSSQMVSIRFPKAKLVSIPANSDGAQSMMYVMTKKADATIIDPGIVDLFNKNNPPGLKIVDLKHPAATYPFSFSVEKGDDRLLRVLNGAISALYNTGMTQGIVEKYDMPANALYLPAKPYKE